ncbi:MAG: FixH family protein [Pseudomonadota bacterium]
MTSTFRLTGKHVLAIIVAFFMSIFVANTIFVTLAIKSFPGEQEKKSYLQGLAFNQRVAEREAQKKLGWTALISEASLNSGVAEIELTFESATAAPVSGLAITGSFARPAAEGDDHALAFEETEAGRYRANVANVAPGLWRFDAVAVSERGEKFVLEKRMTLE